MSSGSPRAPSTTGMPRASQTIRRAISALIGPPRASDAAPDPALEHGQAHGDHDLRAFPTFGG